MILEQITNISHTPGILYAISYSVACLIYAGVLPKRPLNTVSRIGMIAFLGAGLSAFMMLTDGIDVRFFVPCMLLDVAIMIAFLHGYCQISLKKVFYFLVRAFLLGEYAAAINWCLYYYLRTNEWINGSAVMMMIITCVDYAGVFTICHMIERRYRETNEQMVISRNQLVGEIFLTILIYVASNLSFIYSNTPFSGRSNSEIFIIRALIDLSGVVMLSANHTQSQSLIAKIRADYLQKLLTMQYDNYRIHEESVRLVNQKYHDLKHQIALLRSEIPSAEKAAFLDAMEKDIRSYEAQNKTGNAYLDTVLTARSLQCQSEGISLTCTADGEALRFMNAMDVSVLFGNALDNAIESVRKLDHSEQRLIHLTVNRQKSFVRIHIENCFNGELELVNGMPATTKEDTQFHGFGLQSIRTIVDKYGGSMTIHAENGWFELRILFTTEA